MLTEPWSVGMYSSRLRTSRRPILLRPLQFMKPFTTCTIRFRLKYTASACRCFLLAPTQEPRRSIPCSMKPSPWPLRVCLTFAWARMMRSPKGIRTAMPTSPVPDASSRRSSISGSPGAARLTSSSCKLTWTGARRNLPLISPVPDSCWFLESSSLRHQPRPPWINC